MGRKREHVSEKSTEITRKWEAKDTFYQKSHQVGWLSDADVVVGAVVCRCNERLAGRWRVLWEE